MAFVFYNDFLTSMLDQSADGIDLNDDTIKVALLTSSYAPDTAAHTYWSDVNTNEVTGDSYTSGGQTLANTSVTESGGTVTFDADDVQWAQGSSGFTNARYYVLYKDTGTASTSPLIGYEDMTSDQSNDAGTFDIQWNASGIFTLS